MHIYSFRRMKRIHLKNHAEDVEKYSPAGMRESVTRRTANTQRSQILYAKNVERHTQGKTTNSDMQENVSQGKHYFDATNVTNHFPPLRH